MINTDFMKPDVRTCFFGDSFVAGVGDSTGLGWVGRVSVAARSAGHRLTSYNLGVRRETSPQIAARIPVEAPPRLADAEDPRLVVSFGVNDTTEESGMLRASAEEGVQALQAVALSIPPERVLFVGPPAVADTSQNERIESLEHAFRTECARLGFAFIPTFHKTLEDATWNHQVATGDGYHPDAEGYELLASVIEPRWGDWIAHPLKAYRSLDS